ncbi:hypothetical protein V7122_02455 [Bacillus sp. JJ1532]|uniref:hypothetical protein n=1 Tax=Bacillus sp. JJ1532 TaxID=3122958 RepID=UPI002FFD8A56
MTRTESLIEALKEWDETTLDKTLELRDLVFLVGFQIGMDIIDEEEPLVTLKKTIEDILIKTQMFESFLINALVQAVTNNLKHNYENLDTAIERNERLLQRAIEHNRSHDMVQTIKETLVRLKDPEFTPRSINQLLVWEKITLKTFSPENNQKWDDDEFKKNYELFKMNR